MPRCCFLIVAVALLCSQASAFSPVGLVATRPLASSWSSWSSSSSSTALHMGMSRKAKRQMQQEQRTKKGRDMKFREALKKDEDDDESKGFDDSPRKKKEPTPQAQPDPTNNAAAEEINKRIEDRPDVSNLYVDDETGMEVIQQGRFVMDVITRKAVAISSQPDMQLAQFFPGVPPEIRDQHRVQDWTSVSVPDLMDAFETSLLVNNKMPTSPSVANKAIDFVLANRDRLGHDMIKTLGKLVLRAAWKEDESEMKKYRGLLHSLLLIENKVSAPFRQILMNAEVAIGPNFGNLELKSYCGQTVVDQAASYIVLKGMQCTWEKKVRDADVIENTPRTEENYARILATGDPRRYEPEPDVIWELKEASRVCAMSQEMVSLFVGIPELFDNLPPELRFLEQALGIKGGAALRKFMEEDFCPAEGITSTALIEGMRRLLQQLDNMYLDPYADIRNVVANLARAMAVGSDDAFSPYDPYLGNLSQDSPGYFQTYTFNHHPMSLVRFLDSEKFEKVQQKGEKPVDLNPFSALFDDMTGKTAPKNQQRDSRPTVGEDFPEYVAPPERSVNRPHNLGWLEKLDEIMEAEDSDEVFAQVPAGEIIFE